MRDKLHALTLTESRHGTSAVSVYTVLDWACDTIVPDTAILDLIVDSDDDDTELRLPEEILDAFVDAFDATTDKTRAQQYLGGLTPEALTELGAAARRLDRLCKAEAKHRRPSCDTK
jgi:hypothetical protein